MNKYEWKDSAACSEYDTDLFFDKYEEDQLLRPAIDNLCSECPVRKKCFAVGVSQKEWGVWGGIYLENGQISREFSDHRTKQSWGDTWKHLVMD
jgi:hypothetical protein